MKNKRLYILIILGFILIYFHYTKPNKFLKTYVGVKCYINNDNYEQKVLVKFEGKYIKKPFSNNIFKGNLYIDDYVLNNIKIEFSSNGNASIKYYKNINDDFEEHYGWITMDKTKNYLVILLPEAKKDGKDSGSNWTYDNGLIISAPANSKNDAIKIANELLNVK
ncbi:hypothetical protein K144316041_p10690 (plasmid) [Clostridium tetani]|uniref:Uncharacterized protein n=1 Tax=Clostridium tetani TaxID=1513 RepID=A0A4Q0VA16_CLOTA|nr:hypothetical protein [Clostridium tetani]RXI44299.1 hypothetical protein DP130_13575 [Clostridium tetani]BDR68566.1 hypothetical protein K144312032_p10560 [Clostridium tetani]BDR74141.1 hypothetical protein K144316041_p10690 [Clostridium tetani]BDR82497.1 hypothetical protein K234311028_p10560 [Clostridium tetani]BDR90887.1 hypothetical protein N072000002_p10560 [Clostridium tetani]